MSIAVLFLARGSLRGGILILAVLGLRSLLRRLPRRLICLLWSAIWLRLALPFPVRSGLSLLPSRFSLDQSIAAQFSAQAASITSHGTVSPGSPLSTSTAAPMDWAFLIWVAGLALLLTIAMIRYLPLRRRLREAIPLRGRLWLCDWADSPFLLGLFRPRIYLPSGVDEADISWIEAHEEAHLRHGDPWRKLAAFLLCAVYWFQPLVWVAFFLYRRDLELACDERTIRTFDPAARSAYVRALLRSSVPDRSVWALGFGSAPIRKRIEAIRHPSECGRGKLALAALLCAAVLLILTVEPVRAAKTTPEAEPLPSEYVSEPHDAKQTEAGEAARSENLDGEIRPDEESDAANWFMVDNRTGEASVQLHPDGSSTVLYGSAYIRMYDDGSGRVFCIVTDSQEGDTP